MKEQLKLYEDKMEKTLNNLLEEYAGIRAGRANPMFYKQCYVSPWKAYQQHVISKGYLIRDMNYLLSVTLGKWYMRLFYAMCYKWRGKKIEGAVWG